MFNILVVEDDSELRELFCTVLDENGYNAIPAKHGENALEILEKTYINLIISDVMMPKMNGYELTKALREVGYTTPILMITAKGSLLDKERGFEVGTDDYIVKPVDVNEMIWRVKALLRRSHMATERILKIGQTILNYDNLVVVENGRSTELPQKEFYLLYKLLTSLGRIFTRRQLIDEIWGIDSEVDPHTLEVHISRLRTRFKENNDFKISTVRGLGYKAVKNDS